MKIPIRKTLYCQKCDNNFVLHSVDVSSITLLCSAGGCLGVGINKDNVTFQHTELSQAQIAQIKKCRETVMMRLRER